MASAYEPGEVTWVGVPGNWLRARAAADLIAEALS